MSRLVLWVVFVLNMFSENIYSDLLSLSVLFFLPSPPLPSLSHQYLERERENKRGRGHSTDDASVFRCWHVLAHVRVCVCIKREKAVCVLGGWGGHCQGIRRESERGGKMAGGVLNRAAAPATPPWSWLSWAADRRRVGLCESGGGGYKRPKRLFGVWVSKVRHMVPVISCPIPSPLTHTRTHTNAHTHTQTRAFPPVFITVFVKQIHIIKRDQMAELLKWAQSTD